MTSSFVPRPCTIAMMATEMPAAMRPYSIAVAPELVFRKLTKHRHSHSPYPARGQSGVQLSLPSLASGQAAIWCNGGTKRKVKPRHGDNRTAVWCLLRFWRVRGARVSRRDLTTAWGVTPVAAFGIRSCLDQKPCRRAPAGGRDVAGVTVFSQTETRPTY